jgi:hypothetical protein
VSGGDPPVMADAAPVTSFLCACCDQVHQGPFPAIAFGAPAFWWDHMEDAEGHELTSDTCVIPGVGFFVRAVLRIPVLDAEEDFEWGVWVSLSEANFARFTAPAGEETTDEAFGWLSSDLPGYEPSTLELKTMVVPQGPELRPLVDVEPTDHPLAVEQHRGITVARVQEIVAPFTLREN